MVADGACRGLRPPPRGGPAFEVAYCTVTGRLRVCERVPLVALMVAV